VLLACVEEAGRADACLNGGSSGFYFATSLARGVAHLFCLFSSSWLQGAARIGELVAPMLIALLAPGLWGWLGDVTGSVLAIVASGCVIHRIGFNRLFLLNRQDYLWLAMIWPCTASFWHAVTTAVEAIFPEPLGGPVRRVTA